MAVVALGELDEIERDVYHNLIKSHEAAALRDEVQTGIQTYGVVFTPNYGYVYAYEVDGLNHANLMDDANIPSLLSAPYIGYTKPTSFIYANTRRFLLSKDNPTYYSGKLASGIGSPHTNDGWVWPLAILMQGFTATTESEKRDVLNELLNSDPGDHLLHESFNPDDPDKILARRLRLAQRALQRVRDDDSSMAFRPCRSARPPIWISVASSSALLPPVEHRRAGAVDIVLGVQWGDEGKGRVVDLLARDYAIVARFGGGDNAGHSIEVGDRKLALRIVPVGRAGSERPSCMSAPARSSRCAPCSTSSTRWLRSASTSRGSRSPTGRTSCFRFMRRSTRPPSGPAAAPRSGRPAAGSARPTSTASAAIGVTFGDLRTPAVLADKIRQAMLAKAPLLAGSRRPPARRRRRCRDAGRRSAAAPARRRRRRLYQ